MISPFYTAISGSPMFFESAIVAAGTGVYIDGTSAFQKKID
jgi:hypothetical protein